MNVKTDPLMELMAKLLFGIESDNIPMKARNMMKTRVIKAAYKYHTEAVEALQEENRRLRELIERATENTHFCVESPCPECTKEKS